MKSLKHTLYFLLITFIAFFATSDVLASGGKLGNETLRYVVTYKWGLIHKDAGDATLRLRDTGKNYEIVMTAKSLPWADRIFEVRDTLTTVISKNGFKALRYVKAAHEGGKYSLDIVKFRHSGPNVYGECERVREKGKGKKKEISKSTIDLTASGPTYDMLSAFYYLRTIDFDKLASGAPLVATVFSGSKAETLTVKKYGIEKVKMKDGSYREGLHITFKFTQKGKKQTSDDIDCWLSTDGRNVPLVIIGKLPIGQIRCYLES